MFSKSKKFHQALEHGKRRGDILEIDMDAQWFVVLPDQKIDNLQGISPIFLALFQRRRSSWVARMKLIYNPTKSNLFIGDFESDIENKGYGSILLRNVIKLAKQLGCNTITGNLSPADSDHFDKLRYLYEKYGFEVKVSGDSGAILHQVE